MDAIDAIDDLALDGATKGVPFAAGTIRLGDIGAKGWNLIKGDLALPAMTLRDSAVANNLALMRAHSAPAVQVKAAGGVRTLDDLLRVRGLGVTRCGATATEAILEDARRRGYE